MIDRLAALSENDLRKDVVMPLLSATEGFFQVSDVHGTNEKGLDIVFCTRDGVRPEIWYGLQLKKGDISGGGRQTQSVREIIDQLKLAGDHKHRIAVGKAGEYEIDHYIVACSGKISNQAREEIAGRIGPLNVDFWDLTEIIRRAHEVMPELLQVADGELVKYLKELVVALDQLDALDQVPGVAERRLSEVFVEPELRRRIDPGTTEAGASGSATVLATSLGTQRPHAVLIGEQNEGKTAILRMIGIQTAQAILRDDGPRDQVLRVPVLLRARDIVYEGGLREAVAAELERRQAPGRADEVRAQEGTLGGFLVLVDGFSELPNEDSKATCSSLISDGLKAAAPSIVIAGRPDDFLTPKYFPAIDHYMIPPLTTKDVQRLVAAWVKDHPAKDVPGRLVERVREALQLPGSPIPAIIGVMMYEKEQRFITNTAEAVDRYMVIRLGRYASEMRLSFKVDWARKQDLLAEVAFLMVQEEASSVPRLRVEQLMQGIYKRIGEKDLSSVAVQELVDAGVLLESQGELAFYRSAYRDFFAAHYVNSEADGFDAFFLEHLFDRQWGHVLVFAAGLRRKNSALLEALNAKVRAEREQLSVSDRADYLYGAYLAGRILSNSEFSDAGPRAEVLKTATEAAVESADFLAAEAVDQFGPLGDVVALVGTEHTLFVSVGVPWLEEQILELAKDASLGEEERYLLASMHASLACDGWLNLFEEVVSSATSPRVVAALWIAAHMIENGRRLTAGQKRQWKEIRRQLERSKKRLGPAFDAAFEVKSKLLKVERQRIQRLSKGG
ncbi:hypothetical protein WI460_03875 [Gemmatimonadota bacterium Y43]|uniref:NACHT domain-containing protein n=1 Tax=Gaopeijia maritima TaxID=3119007 RepID=UPI003292B759